MESNKVIIFAASSTETHSIVSPKKGAVGILIEELIRSNSINNNMDISVVCYEDEYCNNSLDRYNNFQIKPVRVPAILSFADKIIFNAYKRLFPKKKALSFHNVLSLLYFINYASKLLMKTNYDKVIFENNIVLANIIKKAKYKGEYYYHLHNVPRINANCKEVFHNCTGYICVSKYVGNEIQKETNPIGPIDKDRIKIVYNCVDKDIFKNSITLEQKMYLRSKYCFSEQDFVIIFVGRISKEKGIYELVQAIKYLKNPNIHLLIVGSVMHGYNYKDEFQIELFRICDEIKEQVTYAGFISQKDLPNHYGMCNLAVLPSIWEEPAGLTMVEAIYCGLPLITTRSGGIPEYVGQAADIIELDENIVVNLAKAIESAYTDYEDNVKINNLGLVNKDTDIDSYSIRIWEALC